ncbi:outer membrane putative beta-barrel porin/alpha-amylase [Anseongella ginsenosidimutans]|uniref:Outer membrane putative beta-barrel porin/alpha-amylase n=1 Tax=Anseongella ginsenosidimutans TaxID=496056 RepID=A0A4R3KNF1_9SPHI|nr:outer membrane putative beta-barrel porin/alpha-amylase [Anseongella ginsenosidimutans]
MYRIFDILVIDRGKKRASCSHYVAVSQTSEPINTDRPDQSDGTYTSPKGSFQLETGFTYGKEESQYLLHNTMLRYGLFSKTEIRLSVDYGRMKSKTGIMPVGISVKHRIALQKGLFPDITAVGNIGLPFSASRNFRPRNQPATLSLAFQNEFLEKFSVVYNVGWSLDGVATTNNWILTTSAGFFATEALSFFAEYFSQFASSARPDHNIDMGVAWLLKNNLQLDLTAGSTILAGSKDRFVTTGISYRFD